VVILMAMSKLEAIMEIFVAFGKGDTPAAVIENGSTAEERIVIGTVQDIYFKTQHAGMGNPAVIVVGEVVQLHPSLLAEKVAGITVGQFQTASETRPR
jgi:uroporphyrin-III C-methyltransferase